MLVKNIIGLIDLFGLKNNGLKYVSDKKVKTYILKNKKDLAGYFELNFS